MVERLSLLMLTITYCETLKNPKTIFTAFELGAGRIIAKNTLCIAKRDAFPVIVSHALIIPPLGQVEIFTRDYPSSHY